MRFTDQSYETRNHRNFIPSKGKSFGTGGRAGTGSFLGLVILKSKSCAPIHGWCMLPRIYDILPRPFSTTACLQQAGSDRLHDLTLPLQW